MPKPLPTPELLRKLFRYDPETGKLFWRVRAADLFADGNQGRCAAWNTRYAGKEAFTSCDGKGYMGGRIFNRAALAHRVIWTIEMGAWPEDQIDHINGVRNDNRIVNLRAVTSTENNRNARLSARSKSGVLGVWWNKAANKWRAGIRSGGKDVHLGTFTCFDSAVAARRRADIKYGYHENHGR